jgi:hypothetical protein
MTVFRRPLFALGTTSVCGAVGFCTSHTNDVVQSSHSLDGCSYDVPDNCQFGASEHVSLVEQSFTSVGFGCYSKCFAVARKNLHLGIALMSWWLNAGTFTPKRLQLFAWHYFYRVVSRCTGSRHPIRDKCHGSAATTRTERVCNTRSIAVQCIFVRLEVEPRTRVSTLT